MWSVAEAVGADHVVPVDVPEGHGRVPDVHKHLAEEDEGRAGQGGAGGGGAHEVRR